MLNKVILMGRLTAAPELKYTPNNVAVCPFSVAVDRKYAKNVTERQTDFIQVVAWRSTAEFVSKYFTKGQMIGVCGSLQVRSWKDADGQNRYAAEVVEDEVSFCGDRPQQDRQAAPEGFSPVQADDGLPF